MAAGLPTRSVLENFVTAALDDLTLRVRDDLARIAQRQVQRRKRIGDVLGHHGREVPNMRGRDVDRVAAHFQQSVGDQRERDGGRQQRRNRQLACFRNSNP